MKNGPEILFLDIETTPLIGPAWKVYDTNLITVLEESYMLCATWAWGRDGEVQYERKSKAKGNDKALTGIVWSLMDKADIIIAHNGDQFDVKKIQERMVIHGFGPPSWFATVDTLKASRRKFNRHSHSLGALAKSHKIALKGSHAGIGTWLGCMDEDADSWADMKAYSMADIPPLRDYYYKILPWIDNHPNMGHWDTTRPVCRQCGSPDLAPNGTYRTNAGTRQRWACRECGGGGNASRANPDKPVLR